MNLPWPTRLVLGIQFAVSLFILKQCLREGWEGLYALVIVVPWWGLLAYIYRRAKRSQIHGNWTPPANSDDSNRSSHDWNDTITNPVYSHLPQNIHHHRR